MNYVTHSLNTLDVVLAFETRININQTHRDASHFNWINAWFQMLMALFLYLVSVQEVLTSAALSDVTNNSVKVCFVVHYRATFFFSPVTSVPF